MSTAILKMSGDVLATGGSAAILAFVALGLAAMIIAAIALLRARREDIPTVFASFASAFGFRALSGAPDAAKAVAADNDPTGTDLSEAGEQKASGEDTQQGLHGAGEREDLDG
ncbi:hypothetical protein [Nocardia salmonicida]|uniref:hypothetical protein n=1 Tax=Nocardia salmonicida TaxID=53431 RepID=UPI0007A4BABE|nr:hypothetical protein [Nocardia salmonicida]